MRAGASLTQSRGLPSRALFGSAYMSGSPNADHDRLTADLRAAESNLDAAQATHRAAAARLPLAQVNPGQQVLDIQTKLIGMFPLFWTPELGCQMVDVPES